MPALPSSSSGSTSVFNALASYADRIREKAEGSGTSSSGTSSSQANGSRSSRPTQTEPAAAVQMEDGPWETVQTVRRKAVKEKEKEKEVETKRGGSNSRDWRERPAQSASKEKPEDVIAQRRQAGAKTTTKKTQSSTAASSSAPPSRLTSNSAASGPGSSAKPAWGCVPSPSVSGTNTPARTSEPIPKVSTPPPVLDSTPVSAVTPTSPSLNGTTLTATASVADSMDAESTDTAVTSTVTKSGEDEKEALQPEPIETQDLKHAQEDREAETSAAIEVDQTSAPAPVSLPVINPWAKPASVQASPTKESKVEERRAKEAKEAQRGAAPLQFGTLTPEEEPRPLPSGLGLGQPIKLGKKKKRAAGTGGHPQGAQAPLVDASAWPDVATAVEVLKQQEEKKVQPKAKKQEEEESPQAGGSKGKKKWKAIPAAELLAAVDEAAESSRRQARTEQLAKKKRSGSSVVASPVRAGRSQTQPPADNRKPRQSASTNSEIRLPPQPQGSRRSSIVFVPTFGSVRPGSDGHSEINDSSVADGGPSAPLSRQTSRQSKKSSPRKASTQLSSPVMSQMQLEAAMRGALNFTPRQSSTAPLPQQPFPGASGSGSMPRRDARNRDGRASFSNSGKPRHQSGPRGGIPKGQHMGNNGWMGPPPEGHFVNGDVYNRGAASAAAGGIYGMGHPSMFPYVPGFGYDGNNMSFMNMGVVARGGMPPPPMPQTPVSNLDPVKYYLLGQVEFYFGMQNLAMDFFLRQQMDSEGWIDISTIASFNRVKHLTPDQKVVREVMLLSSMLEVREEKVRLAGGEAKRWVLPSAKISPFGPEEGGEGNSLSPNLDGSGGASAAHVLGTIGLEGLGAGPASMSGLGLGNMGTNHLEEISQMEHMTKMYEAFGVEDVTQATAMPRFDAREVESALMKGGARGLSSADSGHAEQLGAVGLGGGLSANITAPSHGATTVPPSPNPAAADASSVVPSPATQGSEEKTPVPAVPVAIPAVEDITSETSATVAAEEKQLETNSPIATEAQPISSASAL